MTDLLLQYHEKQPTFVRLGVDLCLGEHCSKSPRRGSFFRLISRLFYLHTRLLARGSLWSTDHFFFCPLLLYESDCWGSNSWLSRMAFLVKKWTLEWFQASALKLPLPIRWSCYRLDVALLTSFKASRYLAIFLLTKYQTLKRGNSVHL